MIILSYRRLAAITAGAAIALGMTAPALAGPKIANSYICVFSKGKVAKADVPGAANRSVNSQGGQLKHVYSNSIHGFAANISAQGAANMQRANPNIAYCEQDQEITIGQNVGAKKRPGSGGGTTTPPPQATPWGIARVHGGVSGASGTAWIIDSGIDRTHPDLTIDEARSTYFTGRDWNDENGHGTHVSGTIAARDNAIGVIGVAAGATLVAVRVLDRRGSGSISGVIAGVDYVGGAGKLGDVANMSLGGGVSQALDDAVVAASGKVKFVLAAGNEADSANNHSPARANGPNIYTVSAFANGDTWASFSNYGNPPIDFAEPGVSVYSTYKNGGYATLSGTSMAAPHLAGILLLGGVRPDVTVKGDPDGLADTIGIH